jgi:hypothetical protein
VLREINLLSFKCFKSLHLPTKPLTLLTGINSSGKSTVIQALILLHQTAVDGAFGPALILDGSVISLGTLADVLDETHGRRLFGIGLHGEGFSCGWHFESDRDDKRDIAVPISQCTFRDDLGQL